MWFEAYFADGVRSGSLELEFGGVRRHVFGTGEPRARWRLRDTGVLRAVLADPEFMLGQSYMNGDWDSDDLLALLQVLMTNFYGKHGGGWRRLGRHLLQPMHQWNRMQASRRHAAFHYDLDEALFRSFLDRNMQYSCAYFGPGADDDLDTAQLAKLDHVARKLDLRPGAEVLDIGSGWGGLAMHLATACGARVTGITPAPDQCRSAAARARRAGLDGCVRFLEQDYREHYGSYDAVVSVGMFEHVGRPNYHGYFDAIRRLLRHDGTALIHTIGYTGRPRPTNPWIRRYIFPGGYIPSLSQMLPAVETSGLLLCDAEILRLHYARTLTHWGRRFANVREQFRRTRGETFCRMWEFYLALSEAAFRWGNLVVFQLQLAANVGRLPLVRDYLYADEPEDVAAAMPAPIRRQR